MCVFNVNYTFISATTGWDEITNFDPTHEMCATVEHKTKCQDFVMEMSNSGNEIKVGIALASWTTYRLVLINTLQLRFDPIFKI